MTHHELVLLGRVALAFGLCFVIGFERELRGSAAGDRTYAMVGLAAAAVTAVTETISPQAIAGVLTGIGFVGAGMVFREGVRDIKGITSAATLFAVSGVGIVCGTGHLILACATAGIILVDLELRNLPGLRWLDARRYVGRARDDMAPPQMRDAESGGGSNPRGDESPSVGG